MLSPEQIVIVLVSFAVLWTTKSAWADWLKTKLAEKQIDANIQLSQAEKEKMKIVADAYKQVPVTRDVAKGRENIN